MKKDLFKYFYFIIFSIIGNIAFANSNDFSHTDFSTSENSSILSENSSIFQQDYDFPLFYKKSENNFEINQGKIEVIEYELEEEKGTYSKYTTNFDFFTNFFDTKVSVNNSQFIQNRLAPCKYIEYLSTLTPLNIYYCVYRI
ncbi:hypothetical protein [Flavobacterium channae]|uniref:hypothetical protein n=1 Tax=Flavobacterium channae TaxID=2897181 RepID=UPI001E3BBE8D|nr:hypothetical protein [Flavobacterium channae]UGS22798.1 hypothetical protein LOS89_08400 [Flavobacterium channae]